jgi:hypothetical protein
VADWTHRAVGITRDLQERTPGQIVPVLAEWTMVTAGLLEQVKGAAPATVQRNLALFRDRGLMREVTGQGRYRLWAAKI